MGSDAEFSNSGGSDLDDEDSDTIVISSKSRILISPRKKGSKAVSKLLGSAADDVVEQLLGGSQDRREVVSRTKHSTVLVGHKQHVIPDSDNVRESASSNGSSTVKQRSGGAMKQREVAQQPRVMATTATERRVTTQATPSRSTRDRTQLAHATISAGDNGSDCSELSSDELSAPSSDEGQHIQHARQPQERQHSHAATRTRTAAVPTRNTRRSQAIDRSHDCDTIYADEDEGNSEASSSTQGSSLSQREHEVKPGTQRKFDDQLQAPAQSSRHTTRRVQAERAEPVRHDHRTDRGTAKPRGRRGEAARRHVDASDLDDSVILPTSATQEMEDLKQTLKNLAHQDPLMSGSSTTANTTVLLSNPPQKSASFSGSTRGIDHVRKQEYVTSVQNGYDEAAWSATTSALNRFEESTNKITSKFSATKQSRSRRHDESDSDSDRSEPPPVARRLFSTPPPRASSNQISTPPTVSAPFITKRTPSPQSAAFQASSGYSSVLDTSLVSAANSSAQGSRAVLSALKALQDKIRRLEEEREKLMQELSDVKVKARKREAEFASSEKKFTYELGQTKESARAAYDAIRSEREELKLELVKYEERKKAMEAELQHAHKLSSTFSAKADDLQRQLQSSESQRASQHAEMEATRGAHKQEIRDLRSEVLTLQKDKEAAQEQIRLLQVQFERESQSHAETRERLHESEQTVSGITQLNDKLVAKVWEANEIATKATKKSKKLQQTQRVSTLSRPTAASRAASISAANGSMTPGRPGSAATKKVRAGSITAKGSASIKKEKRGSQSQASNNLELMRAANLGRDIPFVLGTSANRSHSIISNVQEAIRQCDISYATPVTNPPPTPTFLKTRKSSTTRVRKASAGTSDQSTHPMARIGTGASILGLDGSESSTTLVGSRTTTRASNGGASGTAHLSTSRRPSSIRVPTPSTSYPNPMKSQIMEDLQAAVENAETEFASLNRKYKDAVARVESGREGAAQAATALGAMLDELEAKGKQLNLLKQVYEQASHSTINPARHVVHSPEAVRRKAASLRILNDYRQMERDAKSPRSAANTPGSPTNTNATSRRASFFSDD